MEQEFGREIVLNDSFVDFRPKNFYIGTNSPQTNENGYDFEQPKDEGGGGQLFGPNTPTPALDLVLQNGFSFLYLSWIYGIPVFFIWSSILFIAIYGVWKSNLSGESTAAETLVDHENKKVMRTWWNIERTKFSFTIKTWLLFVITMAILSFILPIIGLAQFSTIVPIVFAVIGLLLVKAMF
jgi:hypothetical protein